VFEPSTARSRRQRLNRPCERVRLYRPIDVPGGLPTAFLRRRRAREHRATTPRPLPPERPSCRRGWPCAPTGGPTHGSVWGSILREAFLREGEMRLSAERGPHRTQQPFRLHEVDELRRGRRGLDVPTAANDASGVLVIGVFPVRQAAKAGRHASSFPRRPRRRAAALNVSTPVVSQRKRSRERSHRRW
jgi:hypothetical protein